MLSEAKEPPSPPAARPMHRPHNYADSAYFVHQRYEDTALVIFQQQAKKNKELKPSQYKPLSPLSPAATAPQQQQEEEEQQQPQPQQQHSPSGKGHRSGKSSAGGFSSSASKPAAGDHRFTGDGSSGPPRSPPGNGRGPPSPAPHLTDAPSSGQRAAGPGRRPGDVSPPPAPGRPATAAAVVVEAGADGFASAPDKAADSGGGLSPRSVRPPPSGSPVNAYSSFSSSTSKTLPGDSGETLPGDENLLRFGGGSGSGAGTDSDSNLPPSGWTPRNVEVKNGSRRVPTTTTTTSSQDVAVKGCRVDSDDGGGRVGKAVSGDGCPAGDGVSGSESGVVEFGHYGSTGVVTRRRVAMTKLDSGRTQSRVCAVM